MADLLTRTCSVDDCDREPAKRGWCNRHYIRWRRHGDLTVDRRTKNRTCDIDGCENRHYGHGWCSPHWHRWRAHGDPLKVTGTERGAPLTWLTEAVQQDTDDCIEWPFDSRVTGYGCIQHQGRHRLAHHVALELVGRPVPKPPHEQTRHLCGNRPCVNPRHLRIGTQSENEADKVRHGTAVRGERHTCARLTEAAVRDIRSSGELQRVLAERYGVTASAINDVIHRRTWAWLT